MDEPKTIELTIDQEFRDLIRPLMKNEYRHLEAALDRVLMSGTHNCVERHHCRWA